MTNQRKVLEYRLKMEGMLQSARESFEQVVQRKKHAMVFEEDMITCDWDKACAVVFVTEVRAGIAGIGMKGSTAVMVIRIKGDDDQEDRWSSPIPLKSGGLCFGLMIGASKVDRIMVLTSEEQINWILSGHFCLSISANVEATALTVGRSGDAGFAINVDGASNVVINYSMSCKGLFVGMAVRGAVLQVCYRTMCAFHGGPVTAQDIADGTVQAPTYNDDYNQIIALLSLLEGQ